MIYVTQSPSYCVVLPDASGFAINPRRMGASRTAVAGNVIRQVSTLHASSAEATYSRQIDKDKADTLALMHTASSSVVVHYLNKAYAATMSLEIGDRSGDRVQVNIRFGIVREIS